MDRQGVNTRNGLVTREENDVLEMLASPFRHFLINIVHQKVKSINRHQRVLTEFPNSVALEFARS
jgi:hypothetical protein